MNTRLDQVNWLQFVAVGITSGMIGDTAGCTARECVTYWEQNEEAPDWYDTYDRDILTRFVESRLT